MTMKRLLTIAAIAAALFAIPAVADARPRLVRRTVARVLTAERNTVARARHVVTVHRPVRNLLHRLAGR
jgi:hypothetical protein